MRPTAAQPSSEDIGLFKEMIDENRYDFNKLVYIIFPFGQEGHALEKFAPYQWQKEAWAKLSLHLSNPATRYETYRLIVSSGNGAAKTAFGAMTYLMLMYTQRIRARITANTAPQMSSVVWPEYDIWFRHARYQEHFFEKFGTSIKAKNPRLAETWRLDAVTWNEQSPASISGLHNKGGAVMYIFEEAPGIPANIWEYASGAFTETETIKLFFAFGNSDDPESKFEQNMASPLWNAIRIDTRTQDHIDKKQLEDWLQECGGDEDHDDYRVRVRGLPRKSAKDSIISLEAVREAIKRSTDYDLKQVGMLPVILSCDPAWTGGDDTCIWYRQGPYTKMLEKFKLDKAKGQTHQFTYNKLVKWEQELKADAVFIDQGEGTAIYTLACNAGKSWELISFASSPNDSAEFQTSEYANLRAQMYYEGNKFLLEGGIIDAKENGYFDEIQQQLCWTKGTRHKINHKKLAEKKLDIKARVGKSPDVADGFVLLFARPVLERLWENDRDRDDDIRTGEGAIKMAGHSDPYADLDERARDLYN